MNLPAKTEGRVAALPSGAHAPRGGLPSLTLGAIGVVYGDIGTSPLYAMDQIFQPGLARTSENVLGGVSLVVWALTLIVAIKYALLVLRAQNEGEGGVFALYGLLHHRTNQRARLMLWALMLGAGLLLGDGMITPAISVLSAVEGLQVATPALGRVVIPVTLVLLAGLFALQSRGTAGIGRIFGPILVLWFLVIAALGAAQIWAASRNRRRLQPALRPELSQKRWRRSALVHPWRRHAGGHRRRGHVCRSRPFRRHADQTRPGSDWFFPPCCSIIWGREPIC